MNRFFALFINFLFSFIMINCVLFIAMVASASSPAKKSSDKNFEIYLSIKSKTGFVLTDRIMFRNNKLRYNLENIDLMALPLLSRHLAALSTIKKDNDIGCYSGTYTHAIKRNNKTNVTTGCLHSKRYKELRASIKSVNNLSIGYPANN